MTRARTSARLAWAAAALALLAAGLVVLRPLQAGRKPSGSGAHTSALPAPGRAGSPPPARTAPRATTASATPDPAPRAGEPVPPELVELVAGLDQPDGVRVSAAAAALIEGRQTRAIPRIAAIDLAAAAGGGASVIHALGRLGAIAEGDDRSATIDRLLAMMAEEKQRGAPESAGNLLQIYEALGDIGDARAAGPLEEELLDPDVERAAKVVVVQSLAHIGQHRSRAPLLRARARETAGAVQDPLEAEIRDELVGSIDLALDRL